MERGDVDSARAEFLRLSPSGAQRALRFWQIRHAVANEPSNPLVQSRFRPLRRPPPSSARVEPMRQTNDTAVGVQFVLK